MKRDMDLIRLLLLQLEGDEDASKRLRSHYEEAAVVFHGALAIEAGLIHGFVSEDAEGQPEGVITIRLTWEGYEFLESVRNETTWNKAKTTLIKSGTGWTMPILKEVLKAVIMAHLPGGVISHP